MMSNGSSVQSVSLADGTLNPDERVNYTFGLVLGVSEFQQEQEYLLQKAYLYNRALQGYGTVSGLGVTANWQKGEEVLITVSPGLAIDQFGMPIVVRDAQCARLTAWLKKQEAQQAGTIETHRRKGERRDLRVYIIARYDDYPDGQVPVAGQACSSSDTQPIYSRVHDSFTIDFSWDAPSLPAWDSMRCFSKIMARVHIKEHAERDDTNEIIAQVLKLADPGSIALCAEREERGKRDDEDREDEDRERKEDEDDERHPHWYIPASRARASLDRIFSAWVMEVRPKLLPDLLDPAKSGTGAQPDILLAHIDFKLDDDWDDSQPRIEEHGFGPPDNGGRPFLLPTQLMQELLLIGQKESMVIDDDENVEQVREFATIQVRNNHTLHAWIHHPRRLYLDGDRDDWGRMLEVRSNGQPLAIERVREIERNVFEIEARAEEQGRGAMVPGGRVELVFKTDEIRVERGSEDEEEEEEKHEDLGDRVEDKLEKVGHEIEKGAKEAGEEVKEKVEEGGDAVKKVEGEIEKGVGEIVEDVGKVEKDIGRTLQRAIGVGRDLKKEGAKVEKEGERIEEKGEQRKIDADADKVRLAEKELVEDIKEKEDEERRSRPKLGRSIRRLGLDYVGYDRQEKVVVVYAFASHIPVRELATFFVYDEQADLPNMPQAELKSATSAERFLALWFHTAYPVVLPQQVRVLRNFVNQQTQELLLRAVAPAGQTSSWYWALEPANGAEELRLVPGELLAVIFNTNEIGAVRDGNVRPLTEVMKETAFSCVGYDGNHTVEIYHQVSFTRKRSENEEPTITDKLAAGQDLTAMNGSRAPVQPFVNIIVTRLSQGAEGNVEANLELWFHLSTAAEQDRVGFTENLSFDVLLEEGRRLETVPVQSTPPTRVQHNVYTTVVTLPQPRQEQRGYYLRLRFSLEGNEVNVRGSRTFYQSLGEFIRSTGIRFEGDNGENAIIAYVRVAAPAGNAR